MQVCAGKGNNIFCSKKKTSNKIGLIILITLTRTKQNILIEVCLSVYVFSANPVAPEATRRYGEKFSMALEGLTSDIDEVSHSLHRIGVDGLLDDGAPCDGVGCDPATNVH